MVKVYFESKNHSELVAVIDTEDLYDKLRPILAGEARKSNMKLTESIDDIDLIKLI